MPKAANADQSNLGLLNDLCYCDAVLDTWKSEFVDGLDSKRKESNGLISLSDSEASTLYEIWKEHCYGA